MELPQMLLIGGATRNVGKTAFTVSIIEAFTSAPIVAVKIKTIYPGDSFFHGKQDNSPLTGDFSIYEEINSSGTEDTNRMLKAGAKRVFRIKAYAHALEEAFDSLIVNYLGSKPYCFICESNSLRKVVKPGLYILIKHKTSEEIKSSAKELENLADKIIYTDGFKHDFKMGSLSFKNNIWKLKK